MLRTGSPPRWWAVIPVVLTALCIEICGAQEKETSPLLVSLLSNGKVYRTASEVKFTGSIKNKLEYTSAIEPGEHKIHFEMGGLRSNVLKIVWPER
jgi:hypothetical protein